MKHEAAIMIRIDDMERLVVVGQRVIRFEVDLVRDDVDVDELAERALEQAPPVREWKRA